MKIEPIIEKKKKTIAQFPDVEGQTIIHFRILAPCALRVWKNIHLAANGATYPLIAFENISLHPVWTEIPNLGIHTFTLIFAPLDKGVRSFDLLEPIPEKGGFHKSNIPRNSTDVYHLTL